MAAKELNARHPQNRNALPETEDFLKGDLQRDPGADLARQRVFKNDRAKNCQFQGRASTLSSN